MPESDPKVVNDTKSRQSSAAHSARSRVGTATSSSSRPVSRINTASSRRVIDNLSGGSRGGHRGHMPLKHTQTLCFANFSSWRKPKSYKGMDIVGIFSSILNILTAYINPFGRDKRKQNGEWNAFCSLPNQIHRSAPVSLRYVSSNRLIAVLQYFLKTLLVKS